MGQNRSRHGHQKRARCPSPLEIGLADPKSAPAEVTKELIKRGLATEEETVRYTISITDAGKKLVAYGLSLTEETGTLSADQISSGAWKTLTLRRYDITKHPRPIWPGKKHPYQRMIDEMRRILLDMGFTELYGSIVQGAFWNFDALFQPQDHPAREMQDTFHLSGNKNCLKGGNEFVTCMNLEETPPQPDGEVGGIQKKPKQPSFEPTPRAFRFSTSPLTPPLLSKHFVLVGYIDGRQLIRLTFLSLNSSKGLSWTQTSTFETF
jgi:phenylalanyl-tRNA synthetase alpha subunit